MEVNSTKEIVNVLIGGEVRGYWKLLPPLEAVVHLRVSPILKLI